MEQNINGLLDSAFPRQLKAFQLYKTCQRESLWTKSFEEFSQSVEGFFSRPRVQRRKSDLDRIFDRPMGHDVYSDFHLNFRTAEVDQESILNLASWAHHLMRVARKTSSEIVSLEVMTQTLRLLTNPGPHDKADNIEFDDFCAAWSRTVTKNFGSQHDQSLAQITSELKWLNHQLKEEEARPKEPALRFLDLAEVEAAWIMRVREAALGQESIPPFPLPAGPSKQRLQELERVISLYGRYR